jgi:uncharacterized protein YgbK (DUF1537 family)
LLKTLELAGDHAAPDLSHSAAVTARLAIIADDLTGALDAAAAFAGTGTCVRVAVRPGALRAALVGADVVAVSTGSRDLAPEAAKQVVREVLADLPPGIRLFKKVDSRLKGPIAAELAAFGPVPLLVVPALPEFGRLVRGGAVVGHGVAQPIDIAGLLGAVQAEIPDVETPAQMRRALAGAAKGALIVGARGAALALAAEMGLQGAVPASPGLPMLICVGSTDPITLAQVAHLRGNLAELQDVAAPDGVATAAPAPGVTLVQAVPGAGATGAEVAGALAETLAPLAREAATLVLTGGATAEAVLARLGVTVLDLQGDLLPGLPLSRAGQWQIVTKSGGFGDESTLSLLAKAAGAA